MSSDIDTTFLLNASRSTGSAVVGKVPSGGISKGSADVILSQIDSKVLAKVPNQSTSKEPVDLEAVLASINKHVQSVSRNLKFTVSRETGDTIITVVDSETNEIIRQIPPEEMLQLAHALQEMNSGLLKHRV